MNSIKSNLLYMDDEKRILIFSDAGGTGRSYHADKDAKNSRRRVHYLLEPGWRADNAIQGLGRSNRTNQSCAPLFRPVATDVKGENPGTVPIHSQGVPRDRTTQTDPCGSAPGFAGVIA